jgi:hypothetical protein
VSPVSQKGHCGLVIPFILGPSVALVYPVLSLEITTGSFLVIPLVSPSYLCSVFHPLVLLFPFLHRCFLFFAVSAFNQFWRLPRLFARFRVCSCVLVPTDLFLEVVHHLSYIDRFRIFGVIVSFDHR